MGLLNYDKGNIIFNNKQLFIPYNYEIRKEIGYIPDSPIFFDYLTGLENMMYLSNIFDKNIKKDEIINILNKFNLGKDKDLLFKYYSKGMKQKLMLLSMYIANPNLIILDEPTTGLDPLSLNDLKNILLEFKNINKTIILASHDMGFCQSISDEFAIIQNGIIIHKGLNKEIDDLQEFVVDKLNS